MPAFFFPHELSIKSRNDAAHVIPTNLNTTPYVPKRCLILQGNQTLLPLTKRHQRQLSDPRQSDAGSEYDEIRRGARPVPNCWPT